MPATPTPGPGEPILEPVERGLEVATEHADQSHSPSQDPAQSHGRSRPVSSLASTAAATWALFVGIALMMLGNGLQATLVGVRSENEGFSGIAIGTIMAGYFFGILFGSRTVTRALTSVGHIRVFAALASLASAASLVYLVAINPVVWGLMRFTTGFCMAGLYVVAESWINDLATNATRGRLLAAYMIVSMGGFAGGQFLLNIADPSGFELFVVASVLISLSLVPVSLSAASAPPTRVPAPMSVSALAAIVPTGIVVALLVGMANGSLLGMGPIYATKSGYSTAQVSLFMGAPMIGGVLGQFPVGAISDKVSRRVLIMLLAVVATAAAAALMVSAAADWRSYGLMFTIGACTFPLYSLAIAYTNDWIEPEQILGATSALVTTNAIGAVAGPLLATVLMEQFGAVQYFATLALTHAAVAVFVLYRMATAGEIPLPTRRYRPFPVRGTSSAAALLTKRPRPRLPISRPRVQTRKKRQPGPTGGTWPPEPVRTEIGRDVNTNWEATGNAEDFVYFRDVDNSG